MPQDSYRKFRRHVEPIVTELPRVHRFASVPAVGDRETPAEPVAVCVLPGAGGENRVRRSLRSQTLAPAAVVDGHPADALAATSAPWVVFAEPGDVLDARTVERFGQAATLAPDCDVITCDEDDLSRLGRANARVRPGPSPDLLLECDVAGGLICVRRDRVGRLPEGPSWRYELALRLGGSDGGGQAHVPAILRHARPRPPATAADDLQAAGRVLQEWDPAAAHEHLPAGTRRVRRSLAGEPSVDLVVLFRDRPELLQRCVDSVLGETAYENFRIRLVDNGSERPETQALLGRLENEPRVLIARDERPFNFAALNNAAAADSKADFLLFLNNDTEVIGASWLEELLEQAVRRDVGAVAPLLLFGDGRVQHVGAALGMHDYAGHPFAGLAPWASTPFGSPLDGTRNWLAVTAACMLVERSKFEAVGGFDASFVVAGNDVDLCLRLTRAGYRSLCVPHVSLLHHEGGSRGTYIDPGDFRRSELSYGDFRTIGDPFYNPNLTLTASDCRLRRRDEL